MAPEGCAIDDERGMARRRIPDSGRHEERAATCADEVERIRGVPTDEPSFRAYDLNQRLDPTREMIFSPDDLARVLHR